MCNCVSRLEEINCPARLQLLSKRKCEVVGVFLTENGEEEILRDIDRINFHCVQTEKKIIKLTEYY